MLDRPVAVPHNSAVASGPHQRPVMSSLFVACAGLMGAAGVVVAAAGAHRAGGDLARTASEFLLIHAVAVLAAAGYARTLGRMSVLLGVAMGLLVAGAILFGGELALAGLADWRPVPLAAPVGGFCMIAGWLALAVAGLRSGAGIGLPHR